MFQTLIHSPSLVQSMAEYSTTNIATNMKMTSYYYLSQTQADVLEIDRTPDLARLSSTSNLTTEITHELSQSPYTT